MYDGFSHTSYLVRKQMLTLVGGVYRIFAPDGRLVFYSRLKAFKLREDIRLYTSESMSTEVLTIKARQIFDISATYDVVDATTGEKVGALRRKGLKSLIQDEWAILDRADQPIGVIQEDGLAILRRFINFIPQRFHAEVHGLEVCTYQQNFNPFTFKMSVEFEPGKGNFFDRRLGLAAAILLTAVEGRQNN